MWRKKRGGGGGEGGGGGRQGGGGMRGVGGEEEDIQLHRANSSSVYIMLRYTLSVKYATAGQVNYYACVKLCLKCLVVQTKEVREVPASVEWESLVRVSFLQEKWCDVHMIWCSIYMLVSCAGFILLMFAQHSVCASEASVYSTVFSKCGWDVEVFSTAYCECSMCSAAFCTTTEAVSSVTGWWGEKVVSKYLLGHFHCHLV